MTARGHLHFLGIFGHAMRGVAAAAKEMGYTVTGTDDGVPPDWLRERGIQWWDKPDVAHLEGVTTVVISGHTQADHPEVVGARDRDIPIISFPQLIEEFTSGARRIVVAGSHGKSTTTALIAWVLESAGRTPDYLTGIKPHNFDSSVRMRGSKVAVLEGDEYRSSHLDPTSKFSYYHPDVAVLTSVEMDHPDMFKNVGEIEKRLGKLVADVPTGGSVVYWKGSEAVRRVVSEATAPLDSYDFSDADWTAGNVGFSPEGISFALLRRGEGLGELRTPLYGRHNVLNALAASIVVLNEGVSFEELAQGLSTFKGIGRRFERLTGDGADVAVLDDYAHHPTEVKTTIEAAKLHFPGRVIAVFRPHTYSRTAGLLTEYGGAFQDAHEAFITDIEPAREARARQTVSGQDVADAAGEHVFYEPDRTQMLDRIADTVRPGDTVLCMSVGGYDEFAEELTARLEHRT